jgi:hypothetical protein
MFLTCPGKVRLLWGRPWCISRWLYALFVYNIYIHTCVHMFSFAYIYTHTFVLFMHIYLYIYDICLSTCRSRHWSTCYKTYWIVFVHAHVHIDLFIRIHIYIHVFVPITFVYSYFWQYPFYAGAEAHDANGWKGRRLVKWGSCWWNLCDHGIIIMVLPFRHGWWQP